MLRHCLVLRLVSGLLLLTLLGGCGQTGRLFLRMPPVTYTPVEPATPLKPVPVLMPAGSTAPAAVTAAPPGTTPAPAAASTPQS